jgi:hypothetical protein
MRSSPPAKESSVRLSFCTTSTVPCITRWHSELCWSSPRCAQSGMMARCASVLVSRNTPDHLRRVPAVCERRATATSLTGVASLAVLASSVRQTLTNCQRMVTSTTLNTGYIRPPNRLFLARSTLCLTLGRWLDAMHDNGKQGGSAERSLGRRTSLEDLSIMVLRKGRIRKSLDPTSSERPTQELFVCSNPAQLLQCDHFLLHLDVCATAPEPLSTAGARPCGRRVRTRARVLRSTAQQAKTWARGEETRKLAAELERGAHHSCNHRSVLMCVSASGTAACVSV